MNWRSERCSRRTAAATLRIVLAIFVCAIVHALPADGADEWNEQRAVEAAREGLDGYTDFPWYDAEKDSVQRLEVTPPKDLDARRSKWEVQPPPNWSFPVWLRYLFEAALWLLGIAAVLLLLWAFLRAILSADWDSSRRGSELEGEDALHGDIDRVEALPFQLQRPQGDLLAEATRHYEAGNFRDAMIYLYSYQLVQLDRHQFIRLARGKTNRQYLRELRANPQLVGLLRQSMITFEDAFFGHHVIGRDRFEGCWRRLAEFHQLIQPVAV